MLFANDWLAALMLRLVDKREPLIHNSLEHVTDFQSFHKEFCINMVHNACRGPTRMGTFLNSLRKEFGGRKGSMQVPES